MACSISLGAIIQIADNDRSPAMPKPVQYRWRLLAVAALALLLSACGGMGRSDRPAQVEHRGSMPGSSTSQAASADSGEAQIAAYIPPAQPVIARPEPNRAVAVLMQRADDQSRSGDLDGAIVSLERALRIAPEDAVLWNRLAGVRMSQRQYDRVVQLAAKSNALAGAGDTGLRSSNWRMIAQARRALGDVAGARDAERRAGSSN